jgi:hypothetical protein
MASSSKLKSFVADDPIGSSGLHLVEIPKDRRGLASRFREVSALT